jgi:hypothetical protein
MRAARFAVESGELAYDVLLTRKRAGCKPLIGVMQLARPSGKAASSTAALRRSDLSDDRPLWVAMRRSSAGQNLPFEKEPMSQFTGP